MKEHGETKAAGQIEITMEEKGQSGMMKQGGRIRGTKDGESKAGGKIKMTQDGQIKMIRDGKIIRESGGKR